MNFSIYSNLLFLLTATINSGPRTDNVNRNEVQFKWKQIKLFLGAARNIEILLIAVAMVVVVSI